MGVQPFLISSSLIAILAQRLIRVLCEYCKEETKPSAYQKELLGITDVPQGATIFKPKGCAHCVNTGYSKMTVVSELLLIDDAIRKLILLKADSTEIKKQAIQNGMITLRSDGLQKIYQGITSIEEIFRAINEE